MLEITNLSKTYFSGKQAVKNISVTLEPGQIIGLFGENGAGKTTFMKSVLHLLRFSGQVKLDGKPITNRNIARLSFGTCEHSFFLDLSIQAHRQFMQEHFDRFNAKRFDTLVEFFDLPRHWPIRLFSNGQKNQFEVILAASQGADYIFLDEPFAGNDIFNREDFYKVLLGILEPHETLLLSTHLIEEVEPIISRVLLMRKGQLIGDITTDQLEEQGLSLMQYVKQCYQYQAGRVAHVLNELNEEE